MARKVRLGIGLGNRRPLDPCLPQKFLHLKISLQPPFTEAQQQKCETYASAAEGLKNHSFLLFFLLHFLYNISNLTYTRSNSTAHHGTNTRLHTSRHLRRICQTRSRSRGARDGEAISSKSVCKPYARNYAGDNRSLRCSHRTSLEYPLCQILPMAFQGIYPSATSS